MLMQHKLDAHAAALHKAVADMSKRADADKSARVLMQRTMRDTKELLQDQLRRQQLEVRRRLRTRREASYSDAKVANRNTLSFGTGRQRTVFERWTNPKRSRRECTCEYGLQSSRGKFPGIAAA
jgi:hypothetical protein